MGWPGGVTGVAADFGTGPGGLSTSHDLGLSHQTGNNLNPTKLPSRSQIDRKFDTFMNALLDGLAILGGPFMGGVVAVGRLMQEIGKHNPHLLGGPPGGISRHDGQEFRRLRRIRERFGALPGSSGPWGRIGRSNNIKVFGSDGLIEAHGGRKNTLRAFLELYGKRLRKADRNNIRSFIDGEVDRQGRRRSPGARKRGRHEGPREIHKLPSMLPRNVKERARVLGLRSQRDHKGPGLNTADLKKELDRMKLVDALVITQLLLMGSGLTPGDKRALINYRRRIGKTIKNSAEGLSLIKAWRVLEKDYRAFLELWNVRDKRAPSRARAWIATWNEMRKIRRRMVEIDVITSTNRRGFILPPDPRTIMERQH